MIQETEFCIDCGVELETIGSVGVANAWTRTELKSDGKFHFEGFVCDDCHFKKEKKDVKK